MQSSTTSKSLGGNGADRDVLTLICQFCATAELLLFKCICQSWAQASSLPQSWAYSHWRLKNWKWIFQLSETMPYLRSLQFPIHSPSDLSSQLTPRIYEFLSWMEHLEHIHYDCAPIYMPVSWRHLKHIELNLDDFPRHLIMNLNVPSLKQPKDAQRMVDGVLTLTVHSGPSRPESDIWKPFLSSSSVRTLISLILPDPNHLLCERLPMAYSFTRVPVEWNRFESLEECEIGVFNSEDLSLKELVLAPQLRILTLQPRILPSQMDALFTNTDFNQRLEYFHLRLRRQCGTDGEFFTARFIHQVMTSFTRLLVLRLTGFKNRYYPLTREDWSDRLNTLNQDDLDPDLIEVEHRLCSRASRRRRPYLVPQANETEFAFLQRFLDEDVQSVCRDRHRCACREQFSFGQLLTTPRPCVRESLRFIELPRRWSCNDGEPRFTAFPPEEMQQLRVQLMTRMPHLIQAQFGEYQTQPITPEDYAGHCTAKVIQAELAECASWMHDAFQLDTDSAAKTIARQLEATVSEDVQMTDVSQQPSSGSGGGVGGSIGSEFVDRGSLARHEWALQAHSPFHFLRAIKIASGLPLHPSERNRHMLHNGASIRAQFADNSSRVLT